MRLHVDAATRQAVTSLPMRMRAQPLAISGDIVQIFEQNRRVAAVAGLTRHEMMLCNDSYHDSGGW